ncbi:unnamed protein product [Diamesa tonsa]
MAGGIRAVSHVIFDMDGLLLDTEVLYTQATQKILDPYGKTYTWDVKVTLMGLQREDVSKKIVEIYDLPITWEEYADLVMEQIELLMLNCNLCPGAERLVRHLHDSKVPICLATSSSVESVEVKTTHHQELFKLFHHKVMGSSDKDVKDGKPAPDIFLVAARRFPDSPKPEDCLVFEDAPNGVTAAVSAGMQCVMVPDSHVTDEQKKGATIVLKSLLDFKPELFGLPPFTDNI